MAEGRLKLALLADAYAICGLPATEPVPGWASATPLHAIVRTPKELTVVCRQDAIPASCPCDRNWRCLRVYGSFDLDQVGVISSLSLPLAEAGISIFVISSYDTDYIMIREPRVEEAVSILTDCGHRVTPADGGL